ncbi:glycosyltransferase [Pedobacter sp. R20-19]|uniref:glycosyltransferase family 2 protein n=1 Tax=Pedobacter sp. R20-19 TaxID=1270196 RepID=UPI0004935546|nr:glycosyltransferase family 2 protein [Pedobacter sp. R20-19]
MLLVQILLFVYAVKTVGYFYIMLRNEEKLPKHSPSTISSLLSVEIIIPMYNEEIVILKTIESALNIDYENYSVTIIDDGSTDDSLQLVNSRFGDNTHIKILNQQNKGKALALNNAISLSDKDIVICIDADTQVESNVIKKILPYFHNQEVAAVAGQIEVGNKRNLITYLQYVEYITTPNYERHVFQYVNGILVIPGAIGAFRRSVLVKLGGYSNDTLTEDNEMTLRLLCKNHIIRNAYDVKGYTEAPENIQAFIKQRVRWKVGSMQVLYKYSSTIFNVKNKLFGYLVIPYLIMFSFILPIITPIADYIFVYAMLTPDQSDLLYYYFAFILFDSIICSIILIKNKTSKEVIYIVPQRLMLRQLILITYIIIIYKIISRDLFKWENSVRFGNVNIKHKNPV